MDEDLWRSLALWHLSRYCSQVTVKGTTHIVASVVNLGVGRWRLEQDDTGLMKCQSVLANSINPLEGSYISVMYDMFVSCEEASRVGKSSCSLKVNLHLFQFVADFLWIVVQEIHNKSKQMEFELKTECYIQKVVDLRRSFAIMR